MLGWQVQTQNASILRCKLTEIAVLQLAPSEVWQVARCDSMLAEAYQTEIYAHSNGLLYLINTVMLSSILGNYKYVVTRGHM